MPGDQGQPRGFRDQTAAAISKIVSGCVRVVGGSGSTLAYFATGFLLFAELERWHVLCALTLVAVSIIANFVIAIARARKLIEARRNHEDPGDADWANRLSYVHPAVGIVLGAGLWASALGVYVGSEEPATFKMLIHLAGGVGAHWFSPHTAMVGAELVELRLGRQ